LSVLERIRDWTNFGSRLEQSRTRLYRMAYAWCHDPALADDLAQQTVTKALQRRAQLRDEEALDRWLFRILSNCLKDHLRATRESVDLAQVELAHNDTPERALASSQIIHRVREAIASLPIAHRQVLTLVDIEGFSYASVADILEIPIGTVMSRLCRGRRSLRERLLDLAPAEPRVPARIRRIK
jgi:RNA polymerase sigma-70 factor (ECF subfamily)